MKIYDFKVLLLLALVCLPGLTQLPGSGWAAQGEGASPTLQVLMAMARPDEKIPVIVRMKDAPAIRPLAVQSRKKGALRAEARAILIKSLKEHADQSLQPLTTMLKRNGISNQRKLWLINGMALQATPAQIVAISRMPEVLSVVADEVIELPVVAPTQVTGTAEPNIDLIKAPSLWSLGYAGQGITVAIVDSGVDSNHPDIGPRWRGGSNSWFDPNGQHPTPYDIDGHGTNVTGLVLGGNNSGAYIGVAPEAQWIGVKIFADNGSSTASVIHAGFQWLLDPDNNPATDDAPDIVNNSWGFESAPNICDALSLEFQTDVQALKAAGIAVLFAAGNTGPNTSSSIAPANYPESFAVGSVGGAESTTVVSDFSARGPSACDGAIYPEVVAPGYHLLTSALTGGGVFPDSYDVVFGTSFSAPQTSGVMALLLSAFPDVPVNILETALKQSATDFGAIGADNDYGYGMIDALSAFSYLDGQQSIDVTDSINPENDNVVAFGSVTPGTSASASVRVRNTGSLLLTIGSTDVSNVLVPFSITSDFCSGQTLDPGESCSIDLLFAPTTTGSFSGSLTIVSNAVGSENLTVILSGRGNSPPVAPQLLIPGNDATVDSTVVFGWMPASDTDGDMISQFLVYSEQADFSIPITRQVDSVPAVVLGAGGLLLGGLITGLLRRRGTAMTLLCVVLILGVVACGGGGGGDDATPVVGEPALPPGAQSTTVSGLVSGKTYYWKMIARDSLGEESQSEVRTFMVK